MNQLKKISNRQLTELRKLGRKKYRVESGLFIAEGLRTVEQILENDKIRVQALYIDDSNHLWEDQKWQKLIADIKWFTVPSVDFTDISDTENPQGILALCQIPEEVSLDDLKDKTGCIVALDRIQDPGNLGTILRTAVWFGTAGVVLGKGTVDQYHPKVVRSTAGATGILPCLTVSMNETLGYLEDQGWQVVLLDGSPGVQSLSAFKPPKRTVLVVGNEAQGIDDSLIKEKRIRVGITGFNTSRGVESLNAAMALGIALYDVTTKLHGN
ncbi:MAG TPA: RNA methyltransferase [Balneolales bacterium]|nr:RNA methyltransferase [Balneolales bacterium]